MGRQRSYSPILVLLLQACFIFRTTNCEAGAPGNTSLDVVGRLLKDPTFDTESRPNLHKLKPTKVEINLEITSISDLNAKSMDFRMSIYLRQIWYDQRLNFSDTGLTRRAILPPNMFHLMWVPDTFFRNEKQSKLHTVTVPNKLFWIYPSGKVVFSQRISMQVSCPMQLHAFPLDNQTCPLLIESFAYEVGDVNLNWSPLTPINVVKGVSVPEYEMRGHDLGTCDETYSTGIFSCLVVNFKFKRRLAYWMSHAFIPNMMVVILSWVSFWIDSKAVPARISIGLLPVLTVSTQASAIANKLPEVAYTKAIDIWSSVCLIFVFAAFLEYAVVNVFERMEKSATDRAGEEDEKEILPTKSPSRKRKKYNCIRGETIDKISRYLFPLLFLIFNIVFWVVYTRDELLPKHENSFK